MANNLKQNYNGSMLFTLSVSGWLVILAGSQRSAGWWQTEGGPQWTSAIHEMCLSICIQHLILGLNGESEGLSNNAPRVICLLLSDVYQPVNIVIAANTPGNTLPANQRPEMQQYWPIRARHDDIVQVSIILTSYLGLFSFSHTRHRHREQREHVQCRANCVLKNVWLPPQGWK